MWLQAHITVGKNEAERTEALLEAAGALSVTLADAADEPMFEPPPGATPLWQATRVTGLFDADRDLDALRTELERGLAQTTAGGRVQWETLADRDWERVWLERFKPTRFGRHLWVCPGDTGTDDPDATVLRLDPGLAFGTGTHATTALCLDWLDAAELEGKRLIDFGCGSGILGVAAALRGAAEVVAIDHDPQALMATESNALRNGVLARFTVHRAAPDALQAADVLVANILANVLVDLAPRLADLVLPGGKLVLSGILAEQVEAVAAAYTDRFRLAPPVFREDWTLLHGERIG
jgi:ribosomal protein L11 methyltransferase